MFPYRVKFTESEYDIQNNDSLYKIDPKYQNAFEDLEKFGIFWKIERKNNILFCYIYRLHNSYFVILGNVVILGFSNFCYLYIAVRCKLLWLGPPP